MTKNNSVIKNKKKSKKNKKSRSGKTSPFSKKISLTISLKTYKKLKRVQKNINKTHKKPTSFSKITRLLLENSLDNNFNFTEHEKLMDSLGKLEEIFGKVYEQDYYGYENLNQMAKTINYMKKYGLAHYSALKLQNGYAPVDIVDTANRMRDGNILIINNNVKILKQIRKKMNEIWR